MKRCECGCGGIVGPERTSAKRAQKQAVTVARFLPGHNTRRAGGYGRRLDAWERRRATG